jgi:hypothetical protein
MSGVSIKAAIYMHSGSILVDTNVIIINYRNSYIFEVLFLSNQPFQSVL